ncbi:MAG TPA: long-chain fatty acid--CoA ligase [Solirubrobacteraceae bacterium]|nr:long-chain fatty acid--CoA ligase [Solirubrobacteraceae bacterium]
MILRAGAMYDGPAIRHKPDGGWTEISYPDLARAARDIARGLMALGMEAGDRISVLANTRAEWTLIDMGAFCAGAVVAPVYHTNSAEECAYVLRDSDARVVFCEDTEQLAKVQRVRDECPRLEHLVLIEGTSADALSLDDLRARGAQVPDAAVDERAAGVGADDVATLIYTSGTTGPPKGCVLTHGNFLDATRAYQERLDLRTQGVPIIFFMFLPLAHSLARITEVCVLDMGGTLVFWQRRPELLLSDIRESRPTYLPSVPRIFEKIYAAAHSGVAEQPRHRRAIFDWSVRTGGRMRELERAGRHIPAGLALRHRVADRLVLSKVRDLFGGDLRLAASGAAPIAKEVLEFFDACGVLVLEAWGMTETAAAGTINTIDELRFGSVGRPLPGVEMRIAADGELLMRGPSVFRGYFKNDEATRETLDDGWLATGDLAAIDEDGFVSIIGRKKDLIITSSGKNISPTNIENALKQDPLISEAVVFGDKRPYLVALLTLDEDEAAKLAAHLGLEPDVATMARDPRVRAALQAAVDEANSHFARIEQIKRFTVLDRDLTQAAGELTPTLKLKRNVVYQKFADVFAWLYEDAAA